MDAQDAKTAYTKIVAHIDSQGYAYSEWYCGIATDWEDRLFNEHKVPKKGHARITKKCHNDDDSRIVETALVKLGCDGGPGGGDESSVYVYAYLKGSMTRE